MTYEHPLWPLALKNPTAVPLAQAGGAQELRASVSEAWHIMHGRDMSGEEARGSQDIRARGGDGTLQIAQPSEDLTSIAADIEFSDP